MLNLYGEYSTMPPLPKKITEVPCLLQSAPKELSVKDGKETQSENVVSDIEQRIKKSVK